MTDNVNSADGEISGEWVEYMDDWFFVPDDVPDLIEIPESDLANQDSPNSETSENVENQPKRRQRL